MYNFNGEKSENYIGKRIRTIRQEQGLSQGELAEKVNEITERYSDNNTALNANRIQQLFLSVSSL